MKRELIFAFILFVFLMRFVSAAVIFSDGFESGNLEGWNLTALFGANNWTANQTDPLDGSWHAQAQPNSGNIIPVSIMEKNISTRGYQNITFSYYRKLIGLDIVLDLFIVQWYNGTDFKTLELKINTNDLQYVYKEFNLTDSANNNSDFRIRFGCAATGIDEFCRVDNVLITGASEDAIPPIVDLINPPNNTVTTANINYFSANFSDDGELRNATLYLWNSSGSPAGANFTNISGTANTTNLSLALPYVGTFFWNYIAIDSSSNSAFSNSNFTLYYADVVYPLISIKSPENKTYSNATILVNISASDNEGISSIWFYNGTANETYSSPVLRAFPDGGNTLIAYVNDTSGNLNQSSVTFSVNSSVSQATVPIVKISYPSHASTYGNNDSIALNFSIFGENIDSCWYTLNEVNQSIASCINTTFSVESGFYNLKVYANESASGLMGNDSLLFYVNAGKPTIHLISPFHNSYLNSSLVNFSYIPSISNGNFQRCDLFGNFNSSYGLNQSNSSSIISGEEGSFTVNLSEGNYSWAILCADSMNNISITGNRSFVVDMTSPDVTADSDGSYAPGEVALNYSANDTSPTVCIYNISVLETGTEVLVNSTAVRCDNVIVNVNVVITNEGNYNLNVNARDAAGNNGNSQKSFSVTGGSSSSGGGGNSANPVETQPLLDIPSLSPISIQGGTRTDFELLVINTGGRFLNSCKLSFEGTAADWLENSETKGIAVGEKYTFSVALSVPENAEPGDYFANLIVECDERETRTGLLIFVYRNSFEARFLDYDKVNNRLRISYSIQEFAGKNHDINVDYVLYDVDSLPHYTGSEKTSLSPREKSDKFIEFELPKDSFGEFTLVMEFDDGETKLFINEDIFLPLGTGLAGLLIFGENGRAAIWALAILVLIIVIFVARHYRNYYRKLHGLDYKPIRLKKLIDLKLDKK